MFELSISKQHLLTPLLIVAGAVDKKQATVILSNILLKLTNNQLRLTATDLEIEITACVPCIADQDDASITVPAKKIIDIIRSLEDDANPKLICKEGVMSIKAGRSQFKLTTLPADDYPATEDEASEVEFTVNTLALVRLLQSTYFAMAQQDVRIYLNGLFLEIDTQSITAVTADGHRMAICRLPCQLINQHHRLLIPKKGIQEMLRLLSHVTDENVVLSSSKNHFKIVTDQYIFSSKLIEARFPPYIKAIPKDQDKSVIIDRDILKRALSRIIIMANEKLRAVLLQIQPNTLTLIANNQEHEEGIESLAAETEGDELHIGLNATYLLDVLNHVNEGPLRLSFSDTDSSILVQSLQDENYQYIIMPMKL
ncbi:MAG: DNA polymerase III subunit beta [Legionellaceae bacterium]|nr:DNA polymerase III subunit beta [Legionellaceae bacterium]